MSLSSDQMAMRRTAVTSSDVAALVGMHPYRAPIDVWAWLVHGHRTPGNRHTEWGNLLEPVIRDDYARRHGVRVEVPGTVRAPDNERHAATPDGIAYQWGADAPREGLEIKVHGAYARSAYGKPGTDDVPDHELLQCVWGMRCTSLDRWRLVVSLGAPPVEYVIERDRELEQDLCALVEDWWARYVETRRAPPPDGSDGYATWLAQLHVGRSKPVYLDADRVQGELDELRAACRGLAAAEKRFRVAKQALQAHMGDATDVTTPEGPVTWRPRKDGMRVFRVPAAWRSTDD